MTNQRNNNEEQGLVGRSRMARAWRFVGMSALALPLVVGATSGVALAATSAATGGGTAKSIPVGSYTGRNPQNAYAVTFYVSSNHKQLQDISIPVVYLTCTPGGATMTDHLDIPSVPLKGNGSFKATTTQHGVISGYPATFTYAFSGSYTGVNSSGVATMTGAFSETIKYTDSAARNCTSGTQSWTAAWDTQPTQTASAPPVGSYTGRNPQNSYPVTFYVSSDQKSLQDVSIPVVYLTCTPGGATMTDHLLMAAVALKKGSFDATTTQDGVIGGYPATFTYTLEGNVHGVNPSGAARIAGMFRETITYTDTTARTCTSNNQSWTAARDTQPTQTASAPPVGSYTGRNPQNAYPVTFYVSSDQKSLQDVSIPVVYLTCTPGGATMTDHLGMAAVALTNGAFDATTTQDGVIGGYPATFTYTLEGNVHGVNPSGAARISGMFVETITYTDTAARTCTSNEQSWTVARDAQPTQTASAPPAGNYQGANPQNGYPVTFSVSSDQATLQNVSVPVVYLACTPGGATMTDHLAIASVALTNGAFNTTATQSGLISGHPATFTYTFEGNFHGVNASGAARAAGMFQETITYTDNAARTCTSNNQSWTTSLTS
jgi:precorrin isomerase